MSATTPASTDAAGQVFIIGCPRSGTSALSWALAQHPQMWVSAESDFIQLLFGYGNMQRAYRMAHDRPDDGWLKKNNVRYAEFCAHMGIGVDQLFRSRSGGACWIDSSPGYTLMATELALMFPKAKFLHLVRDGRAVVNSMINSSFDIDWAHDFERACFTWTHYVGKGLDFEKVWPDRVLRVGHAELMADTAGSCQAILQFLGMPYSAAPASFLSGGRINSSYDNNNPEDIRARKSMQRLKETPWESWNMERKAIFNRVSGMMMAAAGLASGSTQGAVL